VEEAEGQEDVSQDQLPHHIDALRKALTTDTEWRNAYEANIAASLEIHGLGNTVARDILVALFAIPEMPPAAELLTGLHGPIDSALDEIFKQGRRRHFRLSEDIALALCSLANERLLDLAGECQETFEGEADALRRLASRLAGVIERNALKEKARAHRGG
jgi:hypothetical protein